MITLNCEYCEKPIAADPAYAQVKCPHCGQVVTLPRQDPQPDDPLTRLIPYKNGYALGAYYVGLAALLPLIGLPLGITALVLGILGVRHAKAHPEARGAVHAWVGIVLGAGLGLFWGVVTVLLGIGIVLAMMESSGQGL